jgi:hypothetical protein
MELNIPQKYRNDIRLVRQPQNDRIRYGMGKEEKDAQEEAFK